MQMNKDGRCDLHRLQVAFLCQRIRTCRNVFARLLPLLFGVMIFPFYQNVNRKTRYTQTSIETQHTPPRTLFSSFGCYILDVYIIVAEILQSQLVNLGVML